jgi:hypothetical protein
MQIQIQIQGVAIGAAPRGKKTTRLGEMRGGKSELGTPEHGKPKKRVEGGSSEQ